MSLVTSTSNANVFKGIAMQTINRQNNRKKPTKSFYCDNLRSPNQRQPCPAQGKHCNNCGIENHFSNVCRKPEGANWKPNPSLYSVEDTMSDAATIATNSEDQVNQFEKNNERR